MDLCLVFLITFAIILCIVAYIQIIYGNIEHFDINSDEDIDNNKLLIKKTLNYNKVFENKYYTSWLPEPIDDYFPIGTTLTRNKKKPTTMAILVKNEHGKNSKDYPSKFLMRCVPEKYCQSSNLKDRLVTNQATKDDKGYELWSINKSNNFVCNNLNNSKTKFESSIPKVLNPHKLTVEKKLYVRNTRAYKKLCTYIDPKTNKKCDKFQLFSKN